MTDNIETDEIVLKIENELNKIAGKDGIITTEERKLVDSIMVEVGKYKYILDQSLADGKIDQRERIKLFQGKLMIVQKTVSNIREDLIVSNEEQEIITRLQQLLPLISEYEDKYI